MGVYGNDNNRSLPNWFLSEGKIFKNTILWHTCDISQFRRDLPIFEQISLLEFRNYTSPYLEFQISLFKIKIF